MTPVEHERLQMLLEKLQRDAANPLAAITLELSALRDGLPEGSKEFYHLGQALKHLLICQHRFWIDAAK